MTSQSARASHNHLPRLDTLRAIAVMFVLLFHLDLEALFYLLPFRAVQFLAGCVIALIYLDQTRKAEASTVQAGPLGEALRLTLPLAMVVALISFPAYEMLSPALMIISCGPLLWQSRCLDALGRTAITQFLARISYQVYLTL